MTVQLSSRFDSFAIQLGPALTEKAFPVGEAMKIQLSCRDSDDSPVAFRLSSAQGGTSSGQYVAVSAGVVIFEGDLRLSQTLYFASKTENATVEVLVWR